MKVYVFSELWEQEVDLPFEEPDLVVLLGDIKQEWVEEIDRTYRCRKIGLLGERDPENGYEGTGIEEFHGKEANFGGITFFGVGGSPIHRQGKPPHQYTEEEIEKVLKTARKIDVLLSHSNPAFSTDGLVRSFWDAQRGFREIGFMIEEGKIPYMIHGHVPYEYEMEEHGAKILSVLGFKEIIL